MNLAGIILLAYFLGGIPFSWVLVRCLRGIDLRKEGSGNPGATNAWRVAGAGIGATALFLDITKGWVAVSGLPLLAGETVPIWLPATCGLGAILGNVFCPFLRFRGGKAVAVGSGVFLGLAPIGFLITAAVFGGLVRWTGKMSVGSLVGAVLLPLLLSFEWWFRVGDSPDRSVLGLVWLAAALVFIRHRPNIRRLMRGEEKGFLKSSNA